MTNIENEEKLDNVVRWTITLPIAASIGVDIERKNSNDSKSGWIKSAIEEKLKRIKDEETSKNELKTIGEDILIIKKLLFELKNDLKK